MTTAIRYLRDHRFNKAEQELRLMEEVCQDMVGCSMGDRDGYSLLLVAKMRETIRHIRAHLRVCIRQLRHFQKIEAASGTGQVEHDAIRTEKLFLRSEIWKMFQLYRSGQARIRSMTEGGEDSGAQQDSPHSRPVEMSLQIH